MDPENWTVSVLDVKFVAGIWGRLFHAISGTQGVHLRATAFRCSNSFLITATRATFPGFPR